MKAVRKNESIDCSCDADPAVFTVRTDNEGLITLTCVRCREEQDIGFTFEEETSDVTGE